MKVEVGVKNCLYPLPTVLVGAMINGKPNFLAIAHVGIMDHECVSLGINKAHFTNKGIKENRTFSINIPSTEMIKITDYCGLVSGKDKSKDDLFKTFYGKIKTAPLIEECPINIECELLDIVDFPNHDVFIGKIIATHCDESVLKEGVVDLNKVQPILFAMHDRSYWSLGNKIGKAWSIGKEFRK